ncbi:hypothetical protein BC830DRAFT_1127316 [Chytriomyces sp. MP71]|nr:hypothetical protein BC830DRAFT_1127316 [Chytriomyces sp. MP71]
MSRTRFSTRAVAMEVRADAQPGWTLVIEHIQTHAITRDDFDFVVNAQGTFSSAPFVPAVTGRNSFQGVINHSSHMQSEDILTSGNVVIVGCGRSGTDFATHSARAKLGSKAETHLIARNLMWIVPQYILGIHADILLYNRLTTAMMPAWFHLPFEAGLHKSGKEAVASTNILDNCSFVVRKFWGFIQWAVKTSSGLTSRSAMLPSHSIMDELRGQIAMEPSGFFRFIRQNAIQVHRTSISRLSERSVHLDDGTTLNNVDTIIFATGFDFRQHILLPPGKEHLVEHDGIYLYRHLLHPELENMAFVGKNQALLTLPIAEMSSHWISSYLRGTLILPSKRDQLESIAALRAWKRANITVSVVRANDVGPRFQQHLDELCTDLGIMPFRKVQRLGGWWNPLGWVFEMLGAAGPKDYEFGAVRRELETVRKARDGAEAKEE